METKQTSLIELLDEDEKNTIDIKKLAEWAGVHYETRLAMNRANALPMGFITKTEAEVTTVYTS